jgi:hypothetical protein
MRSGAMDARVALCAVALFAVIAVPAAAEPVFGPALYTNTATSSGTTDVFNAPAGRFLLYVQNGDDGGGKVDSGGIAVNGVGVLRDADFASPREYLHRLVTLVAGSNTIVVTLAGDPGSFIAVVIVPLIERPDVIVGRLVLPYAAASPDLVIDLKNGSHAHERAVRVHFYDTGGALVAASDRLVLEAKASLSDSVSDLAKHPIGAGAWTDGSVEVFYAGRGGARLFGQAAQTDPTTGIASIVPLQHAGARHRDPWKVVNQD